MKAQIPEICTKSSCSRGKHGCLTELVIQLARLRGWRVAHFRAAKTDKGWRTAVSGDGAGFFDLILVKPCVLFAVELKSDIGRLSIEQEAWREAICFGSDDIVYRIWTPKDWLSGEIDRQLSASY